jgi:hypothetical protein
MRVLEWQSRALGSLVQLLQRVEGALIDICELPPPKQQMQRPDSRHGINGLQSNGATTNGTQRQGQGLFEQGSLSRMHTVVAEALLLLLGEGEDASASGNSGADKGGGYGANAGTDMSGPSVTSFVRQYRGSPMLWFALCQKLEMASGLDLSASAAAESRAVTGFALRLVRQMVSVGQAAVAAIAAHGHDVRDVAEVMMRRRCGDSEYISAGLNRGGTLDRGTAGEGAGTGAGEGVGGRDVSRESNEQVFARVLEQMSIVSDAPYGRNGDAPKASLLRTAVHLLLRQPANARDAPTAGGAARVRGVESYQAVEQVLGGVDGRVGHGLVACALDQERLAQAELALAHPAFCLEQQPREATVAAAATDHESAVSQEHNPALRSLGWAALALANNSRVWLALHATTQTIKRVQSERVRAEEAMLSFFVQHAKMQ